MPRNTNDFKELLPSVHRRIAQWYRTHGRHHLPWRQKGNPYHVYISEVMLQQTQVKTVLERYYEPFLNRFPTLAALAEAPSGEVMKAWEGLGYYSRARNLHAAAQQIVRNARASMEKRSDDPAGEILRSRVGGSVPPLSIALPDTVAGLLRLPGIGRNTAHAVACFGFGAAVPVMEANVKRVLARLFAMQALDEKLLWQHAETLLNTKNAFDHNQAMMDIGAMVCTKRNPRCGECPLAAICKGKDAPEAYPAPKKAKEAKVRKRVIVVYQNKAGRVWLKQRESRFLGGLWGFKEYEELPQLAGLSPLGQVRQVYSHFTLEAQVLLAPATRPPEQGGKWVPPADLACLPLSRADTKIAMLLAGYLEESAA